MSIALSSSDPTEGTVSPENVGFTGGVVKFTGVNWNTPVTITVTGVDDVLDDGDVAYTHRHRAGDQHRRDLQRRQRGRRRGHQHRQRRRGHHRHADDGLTTTEAGGTATFTVVLNTQPTADVTIALSSSDPTEGTVSPASLTFTTRNWNTAQTVTVTGVDDDLDDGDVAYTHRHRARRRAPTSIYNGINAADVAVTNTDNDAVGHHGHADDGPDDDGGGGDGDVHGGAQHAADGGRDDRR